MSEQNKLPKVTLPRTSDGFQKKLDKMVKDGIKTPEDAYKYSVLMFESVEFEMKRLEAFKDNELAAGLIERYGALRDKWKRRLEYTKNQLINAL